MKYLLLIPGIFVLLILIAVVRTLFSPRKTSDYRPQEDEQEALRLAEKLSQMIRVDTTSHAGGDDPARFRAFHKTLAELFHSSFRGWKRRRSTGICCFTGRAARRKSRSFL